MTQLPKPWDSDLTHISWLDSLKLGGLAGSHILDIGCGSGYFCTDLVRKGAASATGIDLVKPAFINEKIWTFLQINLDEQDWGYQVLNQQKQTNFDIIFAFDILEHLNSPYLFLIKCRSLLKPNGVLILTTPNTFSWERLLFPNKWSGAADPQHKHLFSVYSLEFLLRKTGFQNTQIKAPIRRLGAVGNFIPRIGGQILAKALAQEE